MTRTLTLESLPEEAPQETAAVITEGGRCVVVDLEAMWHVDVEPLRQFLQQKTKQWKRVE